MKRVFLILLGLTVWTVGQAQAPITGLGEVPSPTSSSNVVPTSTPPTPVRADNEVGGPAPLSASGSAVDVPVERTAPVELVDPTKFGTSEDPAFRSMTSKMFPMTSEQIRILREVHEMTKRAIAEPANIPPKPLLSSQSVSLSPGTVPPVVRLANGYVTSVVFVDETGAPWPVASYSIGNPQAFDIQWDTESNLLMIQGQNAYATGNMAVKLHKLDTPIMLTLVSEQQVVDYRVDFRVQGRGPLATTPLISGTLPVNSSQLLMNLLDGVPPTDARPLEVENGAAQVWLRGGVMFVRTSMTLLSPSWQSTMSSPDGTKVYQMEPTPLLLVSDRGRSVSIKVKGL